MNRIFFLVGEQAMKDYGIRLGDSASDIAKRVGIENGRWTLDELKQRFPFIEKGSFFVPIPVDQIGAVILWDIDKELAYDKTYFGKLVNHTAVRFLHQYGQSIDAAPLADKTLSVDRKNAVRAKILDLVSRENSLGNKIRDYDYTAFEAYVDSHTNLYGETFSPLITLAVGKTFFSGKEAPPFPAGNFAANPSRGALSRDVLDFIARELPGTMSIENASEFLAGPNRGANSVATGKLVVKSRPNRGGLQDVVESLSGSKNHIVFK